MNLNTAKKFRLSLVPVLGLVFLTGMFFLAACSPEPEPPLIGVKPSEVCMVNDAVMAKQQIPVPHEGKMYYGCCEGCVKQLKNERGLRYSKDPVTGRDVDKATAFIMAGPKGQALYFESSKTARKYMASQANKAKK